MKVNLKEIFKGVSKYIFEESKNDPSVIKKASICEKCPYLKDGKFLSVKDNDFKEISGKICGYCGCSIAFLIRSDKHCDKGKF